MFALQASPELASVIERLLEEYLGQPDPPGHIPLRALARQLGALPLYADMGGCCLLRPDGTVCSVDMNEWTDDGFEWRVLTGHWAKIAIVEAAKKFPELRRWVPERPDRAADCVHCRGTGDALAAAGIKLRSDPGCYPCASLGWCDPEEPPPHWPPR